jgi:hypothetical protein
MWHLRAVPVLTAGILGMAALSATAAGELRGTVEDVRSIPLVRVRITVKNTTPSNIAVPSCGELAGYPWLCGLSIRFQVLTPQGWRATEPAKGSPLPGGVPATSSVTIKPGTETTFTWQFVRDLFEIPPNAHLRLLVDTWRDEAAMKIGTPSASITTADFSIPVVRGE